MKNSSIILNFASYFELVSRDFFHIPKKAVWNSQPALKENSQNFSQCLSVHPRVDFGIAGYLKEVIA